MVSWRALEKKVFQLTLANAHQTGGPVRCSDSVNPPRLSQGCQLVPAVMRTLAQVWVVTINSLYLGHPAAVTSLWLPLTAALHQAHLRQTTKYSRQKSLELSARKSLEIALSTTLPQCNTPLKKGAEYSIKTFKLPLTNGKSAWFSHLQRKNKNKNCNIYQLTNEPCHYIPSFTKK